MLRGKHKNKKIAESLFPEVSNEVVPGEKLIKRKYEAICYRYYYFVKLHKMKFEEMIKIMENEFFVSSERIVDIVESNAGTLHKIQKEGLGIKEMEEKFPSYKWEKPQPKKVNIAQFIKY